METSIQRIPRPRGCTLLARTQKWDELEDRIIEGYLAGAFPHGRLGINIWEFSELYGVSESKLRKRIRSGTLESEFEGKDVYEVLSRERSRTLSSSLFRIGTADLAIQNLLRHLGPRVLQDPRSHPLLVKEFNSAIGNSIRLTETQLKALTFLNQILSDVPVLAQDVTETISREDILAMIQDQKSQPLSLPEGLPDLNPIKELGPLKQISYNREASHETLLLKDQEEVPDLDRIPIAPR